MSALEVQGLHLRLGDERVLRGASLRLEDGELGLLTGPSGGGKSMLLRLLLGLRPRAARVELTGSALLLGQDALRTPTLRLARRAGMLFQDAHLQLTQPDVRGELAFRPENLGLARRDVDDRVGHVAARFDLGPLLDRDVTTLSGGEAKRVALAAILAAEPEALLLDEPLGGLDGAWRERVLHDLRREARGRAALVVEHRVEALARIADARWALEQGVARAPARPARVWSQVRAPPKESPWPLVLVEGLTVRRGDAVLLDDVHLEAGPGLTALAGPNGSGKTTLLRALAGLEPFEGRARVAGMDPSKDPPHRLGRSVALVPQRAEEMFSCASVREELAFGPRHLLGRADPQGIAAVASALGLGARMDRHPLTLSGGEQQRLALACALAHAPKVLLLDEPSVGLDAAGLARALDAVRASEGTAVLVATHDPALLAMADQVVELRRGKARPARRIEVTA